MAHSKHITKTKNKNSIEPPIHHGKKMPLPQKQPPNTGFTTASGQPITPGQTTKPSNPYLGGGRGNPRPGRGNPYGRGRGNTAGRGSRPPGRGRGPGPAPASTITALPGFPSAAAILYNNNGPIQFNVAGNNSGTGEATASISQTQAPAPPATATATTATDDTTTPAATAPTETTKTMAPEAAATAAPLPPLPTNLDKPTGDPPPQLHNEIPDEELNRVAAQFDELPAAETEAPTPQDTPTNPPADGIEAPAPPGATDNPSTAVTPAKNDSTSPAPAKSKTMAETFKDFITQALPKMDNLYHIPEDTYKYNEEEDVPHQNPFFKQDRPAAQTAGSSPTHSPQTRHYPCAPSHPLPKPTEGDRCGGASRG